MEDKSNIFQAASATTSFSPISFRDPAAKLVKIDGRIIRLVNEVASPDLIKFLNSTSHKFLFETGNLVSSLILKPDETEKILKRFPSKNCGIIIEHEKFFFPSFPYEWPPEMLYKAGHLTLDILDAILEEGFGLKDATPFNVLFSGPRPIFIDITSFETRNPVDKTWLPYSQFVRTFLMPLLLNKSFKIPIKSSFLSNREGVEPCEVYKMCSSFKKLSLPFLTLVSIPTWLDSKFRKPKTLYFEQTKSDPHKARFILKSLFKHLKRQLKKLEPQKNSSSRWTNYDSTNTYSILDLKDKESFIENFLQEKKPDTVLDVGCNLGNYSILAAENGCAVVAIDNDPIVIGKLWEKSSKEHLNILSLVVDITQPTPSLGWRNCEYSSFLSRANQGFDLVMFLAVIHHMLITSLIPIDEIFSLVSKLTKKFAIVEFVPPEDPMFLSLTRGRAKLFKHLTKDFFESVASKYFKIINSAKLKNNNRWLYLLEVKSIALND